MGLDQDLIAQWQKPLTYRIHTQENAEGRVIAVDLSGQKLRELPPGIEQLDALEELNLGARVFDNGLRWDADIEQNHLQTLPPEIGRLSRLRVLHLNSNELSTLPPEFARLQNLELLNLYNNPLHTLPDAVCALSGLRELVADKCRLSTIPAQIAQLQQLRKVNFATNRLTSLPAEIAQMPQLEKVFLANNPLQEFPLGLTTPRCVDGVALLPRLKKSSRLDARMHKNASECARSRLFYSELPEHFTLGTT